MVPDGRGVEEMCENGGGVKMYRVPVIINTGTGMSAQPRDYSQ